MENYKCIRNFRSIRGTNYSKGQIISGANYNTLYTLEQYNFQPDYSSAFHCVPPDEPHGIVDDIVNLGTGIAIGSIIGNMFDSDSDGSSSSSDSGFDGFGGGDFGGGGASSDY